MALVVKDRIKETTTTTGTGTLTLAGAMSGFQAFSVIGDGNTTYYAIYEPSGTDWEVGIGTYTLTGTTLSRDTILTSSNSGSAVNFGAGTKVVFCTYPADKSVYYDASGNVTLSTGDLDLVAGGLYANGATNYLGQTHIGDTSNTGTLANQLTISDTNSTASQRIRFQNSEGGFDLGSDGGNINFYGNLGGGAAVLFQIDDSTGDVNVLLGDLTVSAGGVAANGLLSVTANLGQDLKVIHNGGSGNTLDTIFGEITIDSGDGNTGINIVSGSTGVQRLQFSDAASGRGYVQYAHSSDSLTIGTAATTAISIDSSQNVDIPNGDLTVLNRFETKQVTIADDSYSPVTPPRNGGWCIFTFGGDSTTPSGPSSALFFYDVGSSLLGNIQTSISTNVTIAVAARTGTSGPNGSMNIGIQSGVIHFENRVGLTKNIQITFV
jgi:hypothetical protein